MTEEKWEKRERVRVTLSDASPVRIVDGEWPVVVSVTIADDGQFEVAEDGARIDLVVVSELVVRDHADGRRLVYGRCSEWDADEPPTSSRLKRLRAEAGYLLDPGLPEDLERATVRAVRRVAGAVGRAELGDKCIAALPARDI